MHCVISAGLFLLHNDCTFGTTIFMNTDVIEKIASDFDAKIISRYHNSITFQLDTEYAGKCCKRLFMSGIGRENVLASDLSNDPFEVVEQVTRITVFSR